MKPSHIILFAVVVLLVAAAIYYLPSRMRIVTGYAAKSMCSCVFVAKRSPESVLEQDLDFSFIKYAKAWVDRDEKAAYSTILGMFKRKAIYREGLGCRLVFDDKDGVASFANKPLLAPNDSAIWPKGERLADTVFAEVNYDALNASIAKYFDEPGKSQYNTRAVVVVYKDQIVAEKYAPGFDPQTPQLGWSMTKSLTNAMVGALVDEKKMNLEEAVNIDSWKSDKRNNITLNHLMQMSSGLDWNEDYGDNSDATLMLYLEPDKARYAIEKPIVDEPGKSWVYSSGTTNILQYLVRRQFEDQEEYWRFAYENIFHRIGMRSLLLETDGTGLIVGSSYGYATPRDWARFGLLYLHQGNWFGDQVLSREWVDYTADPAPASGGEYGAQFWNNSSGKYSTAPRDMYLCQGFHGQRVFIIPSKEMVIVRLGVSEEGTFDFDAFLQDVLNNIGK